MKYKINDKLYCDNDYFINSFYCLAKIILANPDLKYTVNPNNKIHQILCIKSLETIYLHRNNKNKISLFLTLTVFLTYITKDKNLIDDIVDILNDDKNKMIFNQFINYGNIEKNTKNLHKILYKRPNKGFLIQSLFIKTFNNQDIVSSFITRLTAEEKKQYIKKLIENAFSILINKEYNAVFCEDLMKGLFDIDNKHLNLKNINDIIIQDNITLQSDIAIIPRKSTSPSSNSSPLLEFSRKHFSDGRFIKVSSSMGEIIKGSNSTKKPVIKSNKILKDDRKSLEAPLSPRIFTSVPRSTSNKDLG